MARREKATFAAGCFWGVESSFRQLPGVLDVTVGYSGGTTEDPTYPQVCTGTTGHAEVAQVSFDPDQIPYERLLDAFWAMHDPTTLNRQGPDVGTQYRSAIFFHSPEQEREARVSLSAAQQRLTRPIVTEVTPFSQLWPAEDYHQRYFEKNGIAGCRLPGS